MDKSDAEMRPPHELSATAIVSRRSRSRRAARSARALNWLSNISAVLPFPVDVAEGPEIAGTEAARQEEINHGGNAERDP